MKTREGMRIGGNFHLECFDSEGNMRWSSDIHNLVTQQGLNHILNTELTAGTQVTSWFALLASTNTAAASTMTYAVPAFTESIVYTPTTRPAFSGSTSTVCVVSNSGSPAAFTMTASTSIYGAAIVNSSVRADTATSGGVLFCYALASTSRDVYTADVINLTYQISAS